MPADTKIVSSVIITEVVFCLGNKETCKSVTESDTYKMS